MIPEELPSNTAARFWPRVNKTSTCWLWTKATNGPPGYGSFYVRSIEGRRQYMGAHRVAWLLTRGEIPDGLCVCHHCDNRLCVRPDHLFLGTDLDNVRDMVTKGRHRPGGRVPVGRDRSRCAPYTPGHPRRRHSADDIRAIRTRVASGERQSQVAATYGISRKYVWKIVHRLFWTHI